MAGHSEYLVRASSFVTCTVELHPVLVLGFDSPQAASSTVNELRTVVPFQTHGRDWDAFAAQPDSQQQAASIAGGIALALRAEYVAGDASATK